MQLDLNFSISNYMQDAVKCEVPTEINICILIWNLVAAVRRDGAFGIATRYGNRIPVEARFSAPVKTGPGGPPSLLCNGYRVFPGGNAAVAWR